MFAAYLGNISVKIKVAAKENINTGSLGSETFLIILGAASQKESLSISKNLKWSYRRRMRSRDFITCSAPLGYLLTITLLHSYNLLAHYIF